MGLFSKNQQAFPTEAELQDTEEPFGEEPDGEQYDGVGEELFAEVEQAEAEQRELDVADARYLKASYYREILDQDLFDANDEMAAEVNAEIRDYVRARFHALMGLRPDTVTPSAPVSNFKPEEEKVLKVWADQLLKRPAFAKLAASSIPAEAVQAVPAAPEAPARSQLRQQPAAPPPPARPVMRRAAAPRPAVAAPVQPARAPARAAKPAAAPKQRRAPAPQSAPGGKNAGRFEEVQDPSTGKTIRLSLEEQAVPQGIKPAAFPAGPANFATGDVSSVGGMNEGSKNRLVNHFLRQPG